MSQPTLKLRTPTQSGTQESPRGNLLYASDVLDALNAIVCHPSYDTIDTSDALDALYEELKEQIELAPHAPNHYK